MGEAAVVPVVGIGASAGGLEALKTLVAEIDARTGAAYVIVQHLAPDQKSILHELLQGRTELPVAQIEDGQRIEADRFYVVPPGRVAAISDGRLTLSDRDGRDAQHRPIDAFFASMAEARGRDAYCVVLSGTGSDGTDGLKAVKAAGGFALVQESGGARFPGMPDSAVATGLVDFVLPAAQIARRLHDMIRHRRGLAQGADPEDLKAAIEAALPRITAPLMAATGNDFSAYKPGTLVRRVERRMTVLRERDVERFIGLLEGEEEAHRLAQDFLIGVTEFFRDPDAFEALRRLVVRPLLEREGNTIRIWSPGCSTGEEAYSLAILFTEEMEAKGDRRVLQIFGTDIDGPSLAAARYGVFSPASVDRLEGARRDRFFLREGDGFRATPGLRETCVFAPHNLLQDPPFSRLDLISCRNLMIYLSADLQQQVIARFHYSLRGEGHLFLGPSESIAGEEGLFDVADKAHRIFRKNIGASTDYSSLADMPRRPRAGRPDAPPPRAAPDLRQDLAREAAVEREFVRRYAAPFALLSRSGDVLYLSQQMTAFVRPSQGTPSVTIDAYLAPELRVPVRSALAKAHETGRSVRVDNVLVAGAEAPRVFDVEVGPVGSDYILVLTEARAVGTGDLGDAVGDRETADRDILETENVQLRRQLAATLQEYETSGQELKSSNEELMSMNEELQSSNEELETSREELQSINEELETVNAELQENNRLLGRSNSDIKNLFESTDLAVLFLDREFCVRNFTPPTASIFGIRGRDIGRPISDLSSKIDYPELREDAARVNETLRTVEREVEVRASGETFLLRVKPYRTVDDRLDGYVLSFFDITSRKSYEETLKRNEQEMARQYAELENLYDTTPVGLALTDADLRWVRVNETMAAINGYPVADHIGVAIHDLLPELRDTVVPIHHLVFETGEPVLGVAIEGETHAAPGETRNWLADYYPVTQDGRVFAVGACVREVTDQARMVARIQDQNDRQRLLLGELQHRVKNMLATISAISKLLLKGIDDPAVYQERLLERLGAISRTHDLLTDADWTDATFAEIVANEARPYVQAGADRVSLGGPALSLNAKEALSIGMAIHELMTNAAKYGALSVEAGRIEIATARDASDGRDRARIVWQERDGPPIEAPPARTGFGSVVIERVLKSDLNGEVEVDYRPEGLRFSVEFDLENG